MSFLERNIDGFVTRNYANKATKLDKIDAFLLDRYLPKLDAIDKFIMRRYIMDIAWVMGTGMIVGITGWSIGVVILSYTDDSKEKKRNKIQFFTNTWRFPILLVAIIITTGLYYGWLRPVPKQI